LNSSLNEINNHSGISIAKHVFEQSPQFAHNFSRAMKGKGTILLVEDDEDACRALMQLFQMEGFEVTSAGDGKEAYRKAAARRPDIIVTDINLPGVSGFELIELIKNDLGLASVPIIAMSAIDHKQLERAIELGAVAAYPKPIEFEQFLAAIIEFLAKERDRKPHEQSSLTSLR
jgi:CheY-like chemotaxis protein